jgi:hypothetical protein
LPCVLQRSYAGRGKDWRGSYRQFLDVTTFGERRFQTVAQRRPATRPTHRRAAHREPFWALIQLAAPPSAIPTPTAHQSRRQGKAASAAWAASSRSKGSRWACG